MTADILMIQVSQFIFTRIYKSGSSDISKKKDCEHVMDANYIIPSSLYRYYKFQIKLHIDTTSSR
jgi:hypothetical protein